MKCLTNVEKHTRHSFFFRVSREESKKSKLTGKSWLARNEFGENFANFFCAVSLSAASKHRFFFCSWQKCTLDRQRTKTALFVHFERVCTYDVDFGPALARSLNTKHSLLTQPPLDTN